jgi:hypothetical protein
MSEKKTTIVKSTEKSNFNTKVENTLDRDGIAKIASVGIRKTLKDTLRTKEASLIQLRTNSELILDESKVALEAFVQEKLGGKVDSIKELYLEEAKKVQTLFRKTTDKLVEEGEKLFPDEFNLLSHLRPSQPKSSMPSVGLTHYCQGDEILVTIRLGQMSVESTLKVPQTAQDLKLKHKASQLAIKQITDEIKEITYRLDNFADTKEEIEAELAKVDLNTSERGQEYIKALESFSTANVLGIEG